MIKNSLIYLLSGLTSRAIPFLLLPVLTHYLLPEELGKLAIFQVFIAISVPFISMNMQSNISRNFTTYSKQKLANLMGSLVCLLLFSSLLVSVVLICFILLSDGNSVLGISKYWLLLLPIIAVTVTLNQFQLTLFRNQERPLSFAKIEVSNTLINLGLSLLLIIYFSMSWEGRVLGIVSSSIFFGIWSLIFLYKEKNLTVRYNHTELKEILHISLPLIPHAVGGIIITMGDRFFLEKMTSTEIVGLYMVGASFGMIVNIFVDAFNRAWAPWLFKKLNAKKTEAKKIVKLSYITFISYLILACFVSGFSDVILPYVVAPQYKTADQFIIWVATAYAFRGMYTVVFPYFVHAKKTYYLGFITALSVIVSIISNYILISLNGPIGAAQALCLSWFIQFIVTWGYANHIYKLPWQRFI